VQHNKDIFDSRHLSIQSNVLLGAGIAFLRNLIGANTAYFGDVKNDASFFWFLESRDAIEKGGFPRAIWTNQTGDHPALNLQIDMIDGGESAKSFYNRICVK
jgi:hypothetical protein